MAAAQYSFVVEKGATTEFRIVYRGDDGTPIDLTNYGARMHVRPTIASNVLFLHLSSSLWPDGTGLNMTPYSASVQLPKTSGSIGIYISAASSSYITSAEAYYDLEITSGSSSNEYVIRLMEGKIKVRPNVTR